ncbi:hypothetical protein AAFF_G00224720 [Aldrovandia affinis]|uniref:Uncharacterized protein n=1 Tax=Aldrovandia affinis TaxID=143900 RepID=A0AAD7X317_9TELE|nr:hypothetical protein AAFF_G00224720 [Aldrovandia affinis]
MDSHHLKLNPGDTLVTSSPCAKHLGVVMDNRLSLSMNIAALLVQAMVLSRLDYCNSLLAGLPASAIRPCNSSRTLQPV